MHKQKIKRIAIRTAVVLGILLILAVGGFFAFRGVILDKVMEKATRKIAIDYNSRLTIKKASFTGLSGIEMHQVALVPNGADTLIKVESVKTSINLSRLLTGDIQLGTLEMKNGYIQLVKNESGKNFDAFLKKNKEDRQEEQEDSKRSYAERAYRLLNKALNLVPTDMKLENLTFRLNDMGRKVTLSLKQLQLADDQLNTAIKVQAGSLNQTWIVKGFADPRNKQADLKFFNADTSRIQIPYVTEKYGLQSGFDTIRVNLKNIDMDGDELHIDGYASIANFMVNHPKIAKKDVVIKNARFNYNLLFGPDYVAIDSTSTVYLNRIKFNPFVKYSVEKDTIYQLKAKIPPMRAQDFIVSLPKGLFTNFEGMEAEGTFGYTLDFMYNKNKPSALIFDSSLKKDGLKIIKYGAADLDKLNGTFTYRAIDNGREQRPVVVGPSNPNYTPINTISPYLRKAVLTSEDPSFFSHKGFITEAFKQSIIKNIKTKKFTRGASTISMQLVKNAFLTREKTLSRKLEEILLVYILENNNITSKQRMLEVYFNIIEWGPNVYGIGEASRFYFQKHPSELTLDECVYLASIIPRPKAFMWQFNEYGNLKSYAERHNKFIKNIMLRRGLLIPEDTIAQTGYINISGRGRSYIRIKAPEPVENDSISTNAYEEFDF